MTQRRVVWFSCGAASAVVAKLTVQKDPEALVVYCDTGRSEHPDNARFKADVEKWIGKTVTVIASEKYKTVDEVFEKRRYMSGVKGALCTTEMKKIPRLSFQQADDIHFFGFTADEKGRIERFKAGNPELYLEWPLLDAGIVKEECYRRIREAGIKMPAMYVLGYKNNNCIGCVKAGSHTYWAKIRRDFPDVFARRCAQSREIGARLIRVDGERAFLDQLPKDERDLFSDQEENISCGPECGQVS
jgi:3'-phosphoadenosine 5'-phosphosulfate sulfotransferase (PAPS reductase)/FAD synthetase